MSTSFEIRQLFWTILFFFVGKLLLSLRSRKSPLILTKNFINEFTLENVGYISIPSKE